jgi:hypothetical protein
VSLTNANLAQFPITVVTTRPAAGPYVMIAFGGNGLFGFGPNNPAVVGYNCGDQIKSGVAWIADFVTEQQAANLVAGELGISIGLSAVNVPNDCMCGWDGTGACTPNNQVGCTLAPMATKLNNVCANEPATQNEPAAFDKAFCQAL